MRFPSPEKLLAKIARLPWLRWRDRIVDTACAYWPSWRQWIGGTLVGALGGVGFYVSPLKERIFHAIWSEQVRIEVGSPLRMYEGDSIEIPVSLLATGGIGLATGFLEVTPDTSDLTLDWSRILVEKSDEGLYFRKLKILAKRATKTNLAFAFENRYGKAKAAIVQVEALQVGDLNLVTSNNFSGVWNVTVGDDHGQMTMQESGSQVVGLIRMHKSDFQWPLHGLRDGSTFKVQVTKDDKSRLVVSGTHSTNADKGFIEIKATASPQIRRDNSWNNDGNPIEFYATARLR
jgi:hypothetical protein